MAKARRVVRKVEPGGGRYFDEQLWPVHIALVVLGGFLMGISAAYLPLAGVPWYRTAWPSLLLIPLLIAGCMAAFTRIDNRLVRRSMQLSIVLCAIVHVLFVLQMIETRIFANLYDASREPGEIIERRPPRVIREYHPSQLLPEEDRPRQDHERPIETETPEPTREPEQIVRQPTEQDRSPPEPQPVPIPEQQRTIEPNVVNRPLPNEVAPRLAAEASRLSRQIKPSDVRTSNLVEAPQAPPQATAGMEARPRSSPIEREQAAATAAARDTSEPATPTESTTPQVARRTVERSPMMEDSAMPTLLRTVAEPAATPRTQVAAADRPSPSRETTTEDLAPANTSSIERATTSTDIARRESEPVPQSSSEPATRAERRESPSAEQPQIAATPTPAPNRQPRVTSRPEGATTAATVPDAAAETSTSVAAATPRASPLRRTAAEVTAARPSPNAAESSVADSLRESAVRSLQARRTTSARGDAPAVTASPAAALSRRAAAASLPNVARAAEAPAATATTSSAGSEPSPSSAATVSRQMAASTANATRTQPAADIQAAGLSANIAGGGAIRATASPVPTIDPNAAAGSAPRRAVTAAPTGRSPLAADSPAAAVAATGSGDPSAQPARMALSRSLAGIAGAARSPNLDSTLPGGQSPSLVASSAARRSEATQQNPTGDALSPAAPAQVARSRAGSDLPTATHRAEPIDTATVAGGEQIAEVTASSSAALTRSDAAAPSGAVTAAKGTGEVDLGPTQVVAEAGMGRAAGGGQAELNFDTQSPQIARQSTAGGAPLVALAATQVGDVAAPAGTTGGGPTAPQPAPAALATISRTAGGQATDSGGPSRADEQGPLMEAGAESILADASLSRAGEAGAADPELEDEEDRARRLARAAVGGGPQLAVNGPASADVPASASNGESNNDAPASPAAAQFAVARAASTSGEPASGERAEASAPDGGGAVASSEQAIVRAEASDGLPGEVATGGGTASPARQAAGPSFAAPTTAEQIALAGAPKSGGSPRGAPLEAQGLEAARLAGGAMGPVIDRPLGAAAGPEAIDTDRLGLTGAAPGRRQASDATEDGPSIGDLASSGTGPARQTAAALPGGGTRIEDIPEVGPTSAVAQAELDHSLTGVGQTPMSRPAGDAVAVNIEAPAGPGGLGTDYTPEVGINTRQARQESLNIQLRSARFLRSEIGGLPAVSTAAIVSTDAFSSRGARVRGNTPAGGSGTPSPQTEAAIERGLAFLARYQQPGGGWSLQGFPEEAQLASDTAATALAVIAFQGAGYNHREFQYKDVVRGGVDFLVQSQKENGDLFVPLDDLSNRSVWLYSHSLAAIALCEAYGMTQDPELKEPAQKAIDFIVESQHSERGGWRYSPGVSSDTSVSGWMMMALKSGELAGLKVPTQTYAKIDRWLDLAQQSREEPHLYRYNPYAPDTPEQRHGLAASKTMTSVGLLMRLYTGWKRDNPNLERGAQFLAANLPALGTPREPERDTYYWYYATQVMAHMGGDYWHAWNSRLHPLIVNSQVQQGAYAGSWDPRGPVPDRWGPHAGRLYVTAMNLLSLEVQYRKLPLYEDTVR